MSYREVYIDVGQFLLVDEDTGALLAMAVGPAVAANPAGSATGTGASQLLVAENKGSAITNKSLTAVLALALGPTAVAGKGILLAPATDATHPGGTFTISRADYSGPISGILADTTPDNIAIAAI
jgi:hypothetical protein